MERSAPRFSPTAFLPAKIVLYILAAPEGVGIDSLDVGLDGRLELRRRAMNAAADMFSRWDWRRSGRREAKEP